MASFGLAQRSAFSVLTKRKAGSGDEIGFPMGGAYYYRDIFARLKTMHRKQNLASAPGIQKEN